MGELLTNVAAGALLAWCALPWLARVAARGAEEPSSRQRALSVALLLSSLLLLAPWLRALAPAQAPLSLAPLGEHAGALGVGELPVAAGAIARAVLVLVGATWIALSSLSLAGAVAAMLRLRALCRAARPAPRWLVERAARLAADAGTRTPEVLLSRTADVPFVTGALRPRIVLPAPLVDSLDEEALEMALHHEVTHIARADLWWALAVAVARIPFALHPTARWLGREIALAREQAVDEIVGRPCTRAYATLLVEVAARLGGRPRCARALVSMEVSSLERRIDRLGEPPSAARANLTRVLALGALLGGAVFFAPPAVARASAPTSPPPSSVASDACAATPATPAITVTTDGDCREAACACPTCQCDCDR